MVIALVQWDVTLSPKIIFCQWSMGLLFDAKKKYLTRTFEYIAYVNIHSHSFTLTFTSQISRCGHLGIRKVSIGNRM